MKYRVSGKIPTPMYDPKRPVFQHDESTEPRRWKPVQRTAYPIGADNRVVSVIASNFKRAEELARVFRRTERGDELLLDVVIEPLEEE